MRSKLHHPNVVTLIGACIEPPRMCMVMELCEHSLHHLLHVTNHFLSVHQLTRIAVCRSNICDLSHRLRFTRSLLPSKEDVACGMRYLHEQAPAVIHRYINVFCTRAMIFISPGCSSLLMKSDLKSANVLLDVTGVAKLCDFGLVR